MATLGRSFYYSGSRRVLTWPAGWTTQITAYLWGGGGGGGGGDAGVTGGNGSGGGYAFKTFTVNGGDVVEITVGQGGGGGGGQARGSAGGSAGGSLLAGAGYSGGYGGTSGFSGSSGGGGGSGGATVLRVNGVVLAVAGGGGGGGGAGVRGGTVNAPGSNGVDGSTAGQNGGNHPHDGGGGGAGGGGYRGGNAGYWGGASPEQPFGIADVTGQPGYYGLSNGDGVQLPSGITPGGTNNVLWPGTYGIGGTGSSVEAGQSGENGFAFITTEASRLYVKNGSNWSVTNNVWVKHLGVWRIAQQVWIKKNNVWQPTRESTIPNFASVAGEFGVSPRPGPRYVEPTD